MARTRGTTVEAEPTTENETDLTEAEVTEVESDDTAVPDEAAASSDSEEDSESALAAFDEAVATAVAERDTSSGALPEAQIGLVNKAYVQLDGAKLKNAAKRRLQDGMKVAITEHEDIVLARAYMDLQSKLSSGGSKAPREPKAPADPTQAFVDRIAILNLAYSLAVNQVPEGVDSSWGEKVQELVTAANAEAGQYKTWLEGDADSRGDEPEVGSVAKAAVKLSLGKSAKPGRVATRSASTSTFTGERRSVAKHIEEAFADRPSGSEGFLLISEIANFRSTEYGDDSPSQGAVSARLFPKSGRCTLQGVTPTTNAAGNKGAVKD
jgi:hypothetical protein